MVGKGGKNLDRLTLMIVDDSALFREALEEALSDAYTIYSFSNGREALEAATDVKPDVMILDLMLPQLDGVTLLHEIQSAGLRPMVLAVTRFFNEYVLESAQELGIGYIIRKPCTPAAVSQRVRDLCRRLNSRLEKPVDPVQYVTEQIKLLRFSPRHNGSNYIREAVLLMYQRPNISITKELYPSVGAQFGSNALQVERSIRSAINAAWKQPGKDRWAQLFPPDSQGHIPRPSNGVLIARLAEDLRAKLNQESEENEK